MVRIGLVGLGLVWLVLGLGLGLGLGWFGLGGGMSGRGNIQGNVGHSNEMQ